MRRRLEDKNSPIKRTEQKSFNRGDNLKRTIKKLRRLSLNVLNSLMVQWFFAHNTNSPGRKVFVHVNSER